MKNDSGQVITSTDIIQVQLNSTFRLFVEIGYSRGDGNNVDYDWKIDESEFKQYSIYDGLDIATLGSYNNLGIEKATMDITFSDEIVSTGSLVTIRVKDQKSLVRQLAFEVVN